MFHHYQTMEKVCLPLDYKCFSSATSIQRGLQSLLIPRVNKPSFLSLSLQESCSSLQDFMALDALLQMGPHEGRAEGDNHFPHAASYLSSGVAHGYS